MVSTCSKAGVNKQADAGPSGPLGITYDLAVILDDQAKMQQELTDLKKRSADEMEVLRQENSHLRWRIKVDPNLKGKAKETSEAAKSPAFQPTEEESEYNPTPHTFTTTQQTPIPSTHPPHFPSTQPGLTAPPTPATTLPTTQIPYNIPTTLHTTHIPPYNPQTFRQPTSPLTTSPPPSPLWSTIPSHPTSPAPSPPAQTPSPLHWLYRQHPSSSLVGTFHPGSLYWRNRPWRAP